MLMRHFMRHRAYIHFYLVRVPKALQLADYDNMWAHARASLCFLESFGGRRRGPPPDLSFVFAFCRTYVDLDGSATPHCVDWLQLTSLLPRSKLIHGFLVHLPFYIINLPTIFPLFLAGHFLYCAKLITLSKRVKRVAPLLHRYAPRCWPVVPQFRFS